MSHSPSTLRALIPLLACASIALAATTSARAQDGRTGTAKVIQGDVVVVRGQTRQALLAGAGLSERDRVVTGAASAANLSFRDGTAITVGPNTTLELTSFQFESTRQEGSMAIGLLKGSIRFITGLIGKHSPQRVQIATSTATIGIRGTDFILEAP